MTARIWNPEPPAPTVGASRATISRRAWLITANQTYAFLSREIGGLRLEDVIRPFLAHQPVRYKDLDR